MSSPDIHLTSRIEEILTTRNPAIIINFSGGKDSQSMAHQLVTRYGHTHEIHWIFADTGWEQVRSDRWLSAIEWCTAKAADYGYPLHVVRNPRIDYLDEVVQRKWFPSAKNRFCTSNYKRNPIQVWLRNNVKNPYILNCKGMRAEESDNRRDMKPWEIDEDLTVGRARLTKAARTVWTWLPIHHWTLDDVLGYVAEQGIVLHPTYDFLTRFSCRVCIFATPQDLVAIRNNDPEAFYRILAIERQIGRTMRSDGNVEEVADRYLARKENGDLVIRSRKRRRPEPDHQQMCLY